MATSEENQELIETIKRPIRHYRIHLWGYGGESAYLKLTKEQYEFWKAKDEEEYDTTLNYMLDESREEVTDVPLEMEFMSDPEDMEGDRYPWYEAPTEFCHQYGVEIGSARLTIDEIESEEYTAKCMDTVVDSKEIQSYLDEIDAESDYTLELINMSVAEGTDDQPDHVLQFYSSEKGTFFEGIFTTVGQFDIKKLKVYTEEFPNGEDVITNISYDGEDIENQGGDTNGKGYSVHMWTNV